MTTLNNFPVNGNTKEKLNRPKFTLLWKNVSVWLKKNTSSFFSFTNNNYIKVINNVSGITFSGTLTAILGTSGSGKTTLLATLSQRLNGVVIGNILLNNKRISREQIKMISGFLPQQELIVGDLTVAEHLQLMARLKMNKTSKTQTRNQTIFSIVAKLGLSDCLYTKVSSLSGGEIKKLSLAEQLITDPPLLFCDEPTTGLDSYNAERIIKILKDISYTGKIVICTIHQPKSGIFEMFDQISFLARGNLVYHGPTDTVSSYFNSLEIKCPVGYNSAEYYISQLANIEKDITSLHNICDYFEKCKYSKLLKKEFNSKINMCNGYHYIENDYFSNLKRNKVNFCIQLIWLLWRSVLNMTRRNKNIVLRFILYMFIALLLSSAYWKITDNLNQKDVQNLGGVIFLIITETIFTFTYSVLHIFPSELPKILREIGDGLYDPKPYYISKIVSLIPIIVLETLCYSILIFWGIGLKGEFLGFIYFYLPVLFSALSATAYGFALSTTFQSVSTASLVSVPIDFLGMTYSGIYINISNLPWYASWLPKISQFYYGTEAISISQWKQINEISCEDLNIPCLSTGQSVLQKYGYKNQNYFIDLFGLLVYFLICHLIGYISFKRRCKKQSAVY